MRDQAAFVLDQFIDHLVGAIGMLEEVGGDEAARHEVQGRLIEIAQSHSIDTVRNWASLAAFSLLVTAEELSQDRLSQPGRIVDAAATTAQLMDHVIVGFHLLNGLVARDEPLLREVMLLTDERVGSRANDPMRAGAARAARPLLVACARFLRNDPIDGVRTPAD